MELKGKRLLVIGGSMATHAVVKNAKEMGVYTIVADAVAGGPAYNLADEGVLISTVDTDKLAQYVKENNIDGIFCGPSEFNIRNTMRLAQKTGLRFYATKEMWDKCGNKESLKNYCKRNGLPEIPSYNVSSQEQINAIPESAFPLIVKPVDGAGSRGCKVCHNKKQLTDAFSDAIKYSVSGNVLVEKYIDNGGRLLSFRYLLEDGECYPYLLFDTYIADPENKKCLISSFSYAPSEYTKLFLDTADANARKMIKDIGLKYGTCFAQALPFEGKFYCHDMGYRLSGGMIYKISETLSGVNDMKMMIRYALTGSMGDKKDFEKINLFPENKVMGQLTIPLNAGKIAEIKGIDVIENEPSVVQFIQYLHEGDEVQEKFIGTLSQHFARISICADCKDNIVKAINKILDAVSIKDENGNEMFTMRFDTNRLYK